jgi:hypothetical protein
MPRRTFKRIAARAVVLLHPQAKHRQRRAAW